MARFSIATYHAASFRSFPPQQPHLISCFFPSPSAEPIGQLEKGEGGGGKKYKAHVSDGINSHICIVAGNDVEHLQQYDVLRMTAGLQSGIGKRV